MPTESALPQRYAFLTDPVKGLENYTELFQKLTTPNGAITVLCEVA